ncbi:rRNA maturation RNase YbeY [Aureimonas frigidaquae]|uniref:rRNA maturation RNase YbeY n=1 Tax=Aureimonas frigidaquae TaxID=424757 RepID=UPI0009F92323|nr:rRNA maturation RNase YbeY [Aureimonas frigidaquae]
MSETAFPAAYPPGLDILLTVEDAEWLRLLPDAADQIGAAIGAAARGAGLDAAYAGELGVTLSGDAAVRALNASWRAKDKPTNILSFPLVQIAPGDSPPPMLGDLVLARETLEREAIADGKRLTDHFRHLLVHGMLHLLGHDHEEALAAERMERLEVAILSTLAIADPYADSEALAGADPAS